MAELTNEQSENLKNCSGGLVKPHGLCDAEHGAGGEEGEEVDQAGEVGASQAGARILSWTDICQYLAIFVDSCHCLLERYEPAKRILTFWVGEIFVFSSPRMVVWDAASVVKWKEEFVALCVSNLSEWFANRGNTRFQNKKNLN